MWETIEKREHAVRMKELQLGITRENAAAVKRKVEATAEVALLKTDQIKEGGGKHASMLTRKNIKEKNDVKSRRGKAAFDHLHMARNNAGEMMK